MSSRRGDKKEETLIEIVLAMLGAIVVVFTLVWLVASGSIVRASIRPSLMAGSMWTWFGGLGLPMWSEVAKTANTFASDPVNARFFAWATFVNLAWRPFLTLAAIALLVLGIVIGRRRKSLAFALKSDDLLRQNLLKFTGIAPVLAIRKAIASSANPLWRTQVRPEEVFLKFKVPVNQATALAPAGKAMVSGDVFDREVARVYFMGIKGRLPDGRLMSNMLGVQAVDLVRDARRAKSEVFCDRLSPEGKALAALWGAVAFGKEAGRAEYDKYRDLLNLSAYKTADGIANLTVVQPLYDKYRKNPGLNKLFAVHHWEHTFLFRLLSMAQKKGRFTTAEVLWLRPTNRVMFFALNSCGAFTPHTEAAATFTQFAYETRCARLGRLPLMRGEGGALTHVIYTDKAIDGLQAEHAHWADALPEDEDEEWMNADNWRVASAAVDQAFEAIQAAVPRGPSEGFDAASATDAAGSSATRAW